MAKKDIDATSLPAAVEAIQAEAMATDPKGRPLTGVEVAALLHEELPVPLSPGTRFKLKDRIKEGSDPVIVTSPDGTIEDAIRAYNQGRTDIRTAKQLIIEPLAS